MEPSNPKRTAHQMKWAGLQLCKAHPTDLNVQTRRNAFCDSMITPFPLELRRDAVAVSLHLPSSAEEIRFSLYALAASIDA
jgi:hypothetical protein